MDIKPWEGKHWLRMQEIINQKQMRPKCDNMQEALNLLKGALKGDWEEQQMSKSTNECQISSQKEE